MKLIALSLVCIAFFPALAQDKPERERRACLIVAKNVLKCQSTRNLYGTPEHIQYAQTAQVGDKWWPVGDDPITVTLEADSFQKPGAMLLTGNVWLTGNVEIHTTKLVLMADQAIYHPETGEIDASGNVHITPVEK